MHALLRTCGRVCITGRIASTKCISLSNTPFDLAHGKQLNEVFKRMCQRSVQRWQTKTNFSLITERDAILLQDLDDPEAEFGGGDLLFGEFPRLARDPG